VAQSRHVCDYKLETAKI